MRMNYDLRNSPEDQSQRMLNALEPGTILYMCLPTCGSVNNSKRRAPYNALAIHQGKKVRILRLHHIPQHLRRNPNLRIQLPHQQKYLLPRFPSNVVISSILIYITSFILYQHTHILTQYLRAFLVQNYIFSM